ncbi:hypothetical protein [Gallaecimonas mangrovi]|uniref:hypothetical protein n=1 Tax=Gallaecimonas mangrovi TaxID=2291597 RepID=UPI0012602635|nr:hypothetical protein [Gallaecimonas mangrovi]
MGLWQRYQRQKLIKAAGRMLAKQRNLAQQKISESWHWGNVGHIELAAVLQCQQILTLAPDESIDAFLLRCQRQLAALAEHYRQNCDDEDGYGLGTVRCIEMWLDTSYINCK